MAGTNSDFDATAFRDAIDLVANMALPTDPTEQPTFYFAETLDAGVEPVDQAGVPFSPTVAVARAQDAGVRVPCLVEYFDNNGQPARGFGIIQPTRVKITVLDTHHPSIEGCAYVDIDGDTYHYRRTEPPSGLFDVTLYSLHFAADTEN